MIEELDRVNGAPAGVSARGLAGSFGIELKGLDIARLREGDVEFIRAQLLEHYVVLLSGQDTSVGVIDAFTKAMGPSIEETVPIKLELGHPDYPAVMVLRNEGFAKQYTGRWHSESSGHPTPPSISFLAAGILPPAGGDTLFANQHLAFAELSPALQALLLPLRAEHGIAVAGKSTSSAIHPVVRTHPETGERALYVDEMFTRCFEGMTEEESSGLLDYLLAHATRAEFCYRHCWKPGDVLVWDNRSVQHRAIHDYGDAERVMYHVEIAQEKPV